MTSPSRLRVAFEVLVGFAMLAASGVVIASYLAESRPRMLPPADLSGTIVSFADSPTRGRDDAPIAMIVYSDFECPFCRRFVEEIQPQLEARYVATGDLLFVFKHFPLVNIHQNALLAAAASECAGREGKFWEMHDALFANAARLGTNRVMELAETVGLDSQWARCVREPANGTVERDLAEVAALELRSTPTFVIGRVIENKQLSVVGTVVGARPLEDFAAVISKAGGLAR